MEMAAYISLLSMGKDGHVEREKVEKWLLGTGITRRESKDGIPICLAVVLDAVGFRIAHRFSTTRRALLGVLTADASFRSVIRNDRRIEEGLDTHTM